MRERKRSLSMSVEDAKKMDKFFSKGDSVYIFGKTDSEGLE